MNLLQHGKNNEKPSICILIVNKKDFKFNTNIKSEMKNHRLEINKNITQNNNNNNINNNNIDEVS